MESWLTLNPWIGMILWTIIYISDYVMTIASARKYKSNPHIEFEGSYELTAQFEKDVNALNPVSKRHILMLILTNLLLIIFWQLFSLLQFQRGFAFVLGMLLLMEIGVHLRHRIFLGQARQLLAKRLFLHTRIIQFGIGVGQLHAEHVQLKALGKVRIALAALGQWT